MIRTKALITNNNDVQHRINNDNNNNNVQWDINNDNNDNIQHDTNNNKCRHHHHQGRDSTYIGSYIHYNDHLADTTRIRIIIEETSKDHNDHIANTIRIRTTIEEDDWFSMDNL